MTNKNEIEIDVIDLFYYLKKYFYIVVISCLLTSILSFVYSKFVITPQYTATTRVYILNKSDSSIAYSDFQISSQMVKDYEVLITGKNVTSEVIKDLNLDLSNSELAKKISVSIQSDTRILQISAKDADPVKAMKIANKVREVAEKQIVEIMEVNAVKLVYEADIPTAPSSPNIKKNVIYAFIIGLGISLIGIVIMYILDDSIKTNEDVEKYLGLHTLGIIPNFDSKANQNKNKVNSLLVRRKKYGNSKSK